MSFNGLIMKVSNSDIDIHISVACCQRDELVHQAIIEEQKAQVNGYEIIDCQMILNGRRIY